MATASDHPDKRLCAAIRLSALLWSGALLSVAASSALGSPVTWAFTLGPGDPQDAFRGQYTLESITERDPNVTDSGLYPGAILEISGVIDGVPFEGPSAATNVISVENDRVLAGWGTFDFYSVTVDVDSDLGSQAHVVINRSAIRVLSGSSV